MENKYGRDEADAHLLTEWEGYIGSSRDGMHPLIHYGYDDKEDMFDAHSYNKGGSILHMLRKVIGDEAFQESMKQYLERNAYTAVEVDEWRMAVEDVTGKDMHWFFDQWYMQQGHPLITLAYNYDEATHEAIVMVKQTQDASIMPAIYQLPVAVDVYFEGQEKPVRHSVFINQRQQEVRLPAATAPALVVFDAEHAILAEWEDLKTPEQFAYQFMHAPLYLDRYQALSILGAIGYEGLGSVVEKGLADPFYGIRALALENLDETASPEVMAKVVTLAESDPHSEVRATAIMALTALGADEAAAVARKAMQARPYNVVAAGLTALSELDPVECADAAQYLENETNSDIVAAIGGIYANSEDTSHLPYFETHLEDVDGFAAINFFESYGVLLLQATEGAVTDAVAKLQAIGTNMGQSPWRRIAAIKTLFEVKEGLTEGSTARESVATAIKAIKAAETNPQLKSIYQQFGDE
ncbi:MAG: M1 family aminopeptidase [Saprospiraceae bacterium]